MANLTDSVAVVAGATRGAGRGIARALGAAGATVYCTGRSVRGAPSPYQRPETIEETAELVDSAGGKGIALRVDHTVEGEVEALFARIREDRGRLDLLVNSVAGEDPLLGGFTTFWQLDLSRGADALRQTILSHMITAKHAARDMVEARRGLIVEVTEGDTLGAGGSAMHNVVKSAFTTFAFRMADELRPYGVAALAITPGFLRSETMLEHFGVTEANWKEGAAKDPHFLASESPLFLGRAVVALAADENVFRRTGAWTSSWEVARDYGLCDADGTTPDWGQYFASIVSSIQSIHDGLPRQIAWLDAVVRRTKCYAGLD